MNEMALSANTHYYTGMLPNLNGSFFYPWEDYYINTWYPYASQMKFPSYYLWMTLFIPWGCNFLGWFWIWLKRNKYWDVI
jgi:asparagine N-glycosylation enzyme membrane subunit Stt3